MPVLNEAEEPNQQPTKSRRACPERGESRSRRGGKRPGAGAPRGNLNALKHGRRSTQFARIGALFAGDPKLREILLLLADRHQHQRQQANQQAAALFVQLIETIQQKTGRSFGLDHIEDWRTIKQEAALANVKQLQKRLKKPTDPTHNQTTDTNPAAQSDPQTPTDID